MLLTSPKEGNSKFDYGFVTLLKSYHLKGV